MATTTEPTALNLTLYQGATYRRTLTWRYTDAPAGPVDLTGASARLQLRTAYGATPPALTLTDGSGLTLGGVAGTVEIEMTDTQTGALTASPVAGVAVYVWDLRIVLASGDVAIAARGAVDVIARTTLAA